MALQLILGRGRFRKILYFNSENYKPFNEDGRKNFVAVVPEQYSMETPKEILTLHPNHGCFNIEVTSLTRLLLMQYFEELGVNDLNVMDDFVRLL